METKKAFTERAAGNFKMSKTLPAIYFERETIAQLCKENKGR